MRHRIFNYTVKAIWSQERRGRYYKTMFMAETNGPFWPKGCDNLLGYNAIASTLPGAIAKLANLLRRGDIGRLHPDGEGSTSIMGLNCWWTDNRPGAYYVLHHDQFISGHLPMFLREDNIGAPRWTDNIGNAGRWSKEKADNLATAIGRGAYSCL